jgi:hypothetical protein
LDIPFTVEQFFDVFQTYNTAIWPAQIAAYLLGVAAVALALRENEVSGRIISGILALFWIWMGVLYHMAYFSPINPAAWIFGALFVIEGLMFLVIGSIRGRLSFGFDFKPIPVIGAFFILYAMVVYPMLGLAFGHYYPRAPMFGVAPCPTTIFTFGLLIWARKSVPIYLLAIPLIWSLIGTTAALGLQVPQDLGLGIAGIVGTVLVIMSNRDLKTRA